MNLDIHITGEVSERKALQLQSALAALALPDKDSSRLPNFMAVPGLYAISATTRIESITLHGEIQLKAGL